MDAVLRERAHGEPIDGTRREAADDETAAHWPGSFPSREAAKTTIAEWIEIFYNGKRRHSSLDYLSPLEFERRYYENLESLERAEVA